MKVLLIHQAFTSPNESGGTRHFELARHAVGCGHEFTIVGGSLSYLTGKQVGGAQAAEMFDGVRVVRAYTLPTLHRSFVWRIVSFLSFMLSSLRAALRAGPVDLVMGTSPPIFQAVSAWLVAAIRRKPFLLEIRDLWPAFAIDMGVLKNPVLIALSRWLERFLYARATHLLVNSPAYRDYLIALGVSRERISLIPNGVDCAMFDANERGLEVRAALGINGEFVVTYAGALGLANDLPTLLRAAQRLREERAIRFLLVGDGKERANLEAQARELKLDNVTFTGAVPKSKMAGMLAASDACVAILQDIPMFKTTYPNKVFDYMAAGRPVVLAIDGVIREVIEAANGGTFVPPGDDAALAAAISGLARDRARATAMGHSARDFVKKNFDRRQQAEDFVNLVESLR